MSSAFPMFFVFAGTAFSLSLSACQPPPQLTHTAPQPAAASPELPGVKPTSSASPAVSPTPGTSSLHVRVEADPNLTSFLLQQADPFRLCLGEMVQSSLEISLSAALSPASQAALEAVGASVITAAGQSLIRLQQTIDPALLLTGLAFHLPELPAGPLAGRNLFLNAAGQELGFVSWHLQATSERQVTLQLRAVETPETACPLLEVNLMGASFRGASGQISSPWPLPQVQSPAPASASPVDFAPRNLRIVEQTTHSLTLQWDFGKGPVSHQIYLNGQLVANQHTFPNYFRFENLQANTAYSLGVRAIQTQAESEVMSVSAQTTLAGSSGSGNFSGGGSSGGSTPPLAAIPEPTPQPTLILNLFEQERQLNTHLPGSQEQAAMAIDAQGNFVVVWQSGPEFQLQLENINAQTQDGSGTGIYAQRYNAAGEAVGQEFQVHTETHDDQSAPAVAMADNGNFVVAWQSRSEVNPGQSNIYAQRFDAQAVKQGDAFRVDTGEETHNHTAPTLAMLGNGQFIVAWENRYIANFRISAQRFEANAEPLGNPLDFGSGTREDSRPALSVSSSGKCGLSWNQKNLTNNTHRINYTLFAFDNPTSSSSVSISSTQEVWPVLVANGPESFYLFYQAGNNMLSRHITANNMISVAFTSITHTAPIPYLRATSNPAGQVLLSWAQEHEGQTDVFARRLLRTDLDSTNAELNQFSDITQLNTYTTEQQQHPAVALAADGKIIAAWEGQSQQDSYGIVGRGFAASFAPLLQQPG